MRLQTSRRRQQIQEVDFARYDNVPSNYETEKSVNPMYILTVDEAAEVMSYTLPVMRPILEEEIEWLKQHMHGKDGDIVCNWESGKVY